MSGITSFASGLRAASTPRSARATLWLYLFTVVASAALFVPLLVLGMTTASRSVVGDDLRAGLAPDWIVDQLGVPGTSTAFATIVALTLASIPLHLALSVFASGGVVDAVLRSLGGRSDGGDEPSFLSAAGRTAWPFLAVALLEAIVLLIVLVVLALPGPLAHGALAWAHVVLVVLGLSAVVSVFDFVRIGVAHARPRERLRGARDGARAIARAPGAWAVVLVLNATIAVVLFALSAAINAVPAKETAAGLALAILLGQASVFARLWARVVAYGAQAAVLLGFLDVE
jgi:hypothetical protein